MHHDPSQKRKNTILRYIKKPWRWFWDGGVKKIIPTHLHGTSHCGQIINPSQQFSILPRVFQLRLRLDCNDCTFPGFDYEIEYGSLTNYCNANGLSRLPLATAGDEQG